MQTAIQAKISKRKLENWQWFFLYYNICILLALQRHIILCFSGRIKLKLRNAIEKNTYNYNCFKNAIRILFNIVQSIAFSRLLCINILIASYKIKVFCILSSLKPGEGMKTERYKHQLQCLSSKIERKRPYRSKVTL